MKTQNNIDPSLQTPTVIEVHDTGASTDRLYTLSPSFELTYECCSGLGDEDHFTLAMLSPVNDVVCSYPSREFVRTYFSGGTHYHDFYELMMVLDGELIHQINDTEYVYKSGTCCLINRGVSHTERFTGETKVLFLGLSPSFFSELFDGYTTVCLSSELPYLQYPIMKYITRVLHQDTLENSYLDFYPSAWNRESARELYTLIDNLIRTILNPKLGTGYIIRGIILYIIQFLSDPERYHVTEITGNTRPDYLLFSHITHFIKDHDGIVTRQMLEEHFHYSGNYINTVIKKYSGMCLFDYRMTFYAEKAAELLGQTSLSLPKILEQLQVSNTTQFYKIFKERYGVTPARYMKQARSSRL